MRTRIDALRARTLQLLLALALVLPVACSEHRELYPTLDRLAAEGKYLEAVKLVEESEEDYGDLNAVLYNLDRGVLLHHGGKYKQSNAAFEAAEKRIDELYTESVTANVAAFALNDNTLPYRGEDFETVLINLYRALNYVALGQVDEALVEARKVNLKLESINRRYEDGQKNVYKEDAFARLLAGVLYEMGGTRDDLNDAYISNRKAAEAYRDFKAHYGTAAPSALPDNLLSTATFMGPGEVREAQALFPAAELIPLERKRGQAELYFVHFAGRAPSKVEDAIRAPTPDGNLVKVAFPTYKRNFYTISGSRVQIDGKRAVTLQTAEPVGEIALQNLQNRRGRITAKAIARALTKYMANRGLQEQAKRQSQGAGLLAFVVGNVFAEVSEQADLRAWQTLPDLMLIGRALVEPGSHAVQVEFLGGGKTVVSTQELGSLKLKAGEKRFILLHTRQ